MEKIYGNNLKLGDEFLDPNTSKHYMVSKELEITGRDGDDLIMTLVAINLETNIEETFQNFHGYSTLIDLVSSTLIIGFNKSKK